jgi:hypothetical protein
MIYMREEDQKHIRWYDYFWLLIPIAGFALFDLAVSCRRWDYEDKKRQERNDAKKFNPASAP